MAEETLTRHPAQAQAPDALTPDIELLLDRARLVGDLVAHQLISSDFASSGELDAFNIDAARRVDSLRHILIGDHTGGLHHLRTAHDLGIDTVTVASRIARDPASVDESAKPKPYSSFRKDQKVQDNGVFQAKVVKIGTPDHKVNKVNGSMMFPSEWDTEQVLWAIKTAGKAEPQESKSNPGMTTVHEAEVDGVGIRVLKDKKTSKIVAAYPIRPKGNN